MRETLAGLRCLVTGAGGFLGSALVRALAAAGAEVHGVLRPGGSRWRFPTPPAGAQLYELELREPRAVRNLFNRLQPEVVLHAAAHSARRYDDPLADVVGDDVLALAHLLDAVAGRELRRLVHLGSSLEYGPSERPHRESDPLRPTSLRGATKVAASLLALDRGRCGAVPVVMLRPFHVYGPWEAPDRLVSAALRAALQGEVLPLTAGEASRRDFVFVDDVAEACLRAVAAPGAIGEAINLGTGRGTSTEELVAAVAAAVGVPLRVEPGAFPPRATDVPNRTADPAKARRLLGWEARTGLAEGLAATAAWMRTRLAEGER